jgi:hypothetical protein|tara:strand:- start:306 stop:695 length:390 start_codon:yes stop_codon:yes gene_type:complete
MGKVYKVRSKKMEVIRDAMWECCLADAVKMYRFSEPNEACYQLANATWIMKKKYQEHKMKKEQRQVVVIDKAPEIVNEMRNSKKTCCATTMSGKPCSFKAVCGDFCKKHSVKHAQLGMKVDMSKIKIAD